MHLFKNKSMTSTGYKHAMQYGIFFGLAFFIGFLISTVFNSLFLSAVVTTSIFFATMRTTRNLRDKFLGGTMTYLQVVNYVITLYFFASLLSSALKYIYWEYFNTDLLPQIMDQSLKVASSLGLQISDAEAASMLEITSASFALQYIWANIFLGLLAGLIIGFFVKTKQYEAPKS